MEQTSHPTGTDQRSEPPLRVALVVASVRKPRLADVLVPWVRQHLEDHPDLDLEVVDLGDVDPAALALHDLRPGGAGSPISAALERADAFLVLTPEYNHSFPASLKNAVDWHLTEWAGKPVAFVGYGAASGGIRAIEQLRLVFPELRATTVRNAVALVRPWEQVDESGHRFVATEHDDAALGATLDELGWWGRALRTARDAYGVPA